MTASVAKSETRRHAVGGDAIFRKRQSPDLDWVEVDGQVVAWTQPNESLHLFDATSTVVFQLMDGETRLAVTVQELAAAYGESASSIAPDVYACVTSLEEIGAVERVS